LSIVLLAILAVMWAAFLLPLIVPAERRRPGRARPHLGGPHGAGWRPAPGAVSQGSHAGAQRGTRAARRHAARRRSVLRRRRVLLALTVAVAASVRAWYLLGGGWWTAEAVTGTLLVAYVAALVARGIRRPRAAGRAVATPPAEAAAGRAGRGGRRRRRADLPLWGAPLLESQGPSSPE